VRRALTDWGPVAAWMVVIFAASSRPRIPYQQDVPDWFSHAIIYMVLSVLASRAFATGGRIGWGGAGAVFLFCVAYGVSDELHQAFVPGRHADPWDVLKDAIGTLIGLGLYAAWANRATKREPRLS
jgi:VanZ family protein